MTTTTLALPAPDLDATGSRVPAETQLTLGGAVVLGLVYPAIYFVTRFEDPRGHEPFWQYQLCGVLFLAAAALSQLPRWRAAFLRVFLAVLFVTAVWSIGSIWRGGFAGERIGLGSLLVCGAFFTPGVRSTLVYLGVVYGGLMLGVFLEEPGLPRATLVARLTAGVGFIAAVNLTRAWTRDHVERAHRRLESFIDRSPLPIVLTVRDECQRANEAARELLGIVPGDPLGRFLTAEAPWWLGSRERGRAVLTLRAVDGTLRECEVAYAAFDQEAQPGAMQLVVLDRTEDEARLRSKDAVLASTRRELRAPLAAIKTALAVLESPVSQLDTASLAEPESRHIVQQARRAREYLERLTDELTLARSHARAPLAAAAAEPRVVSAGDLAEHALKLAERTAAQRGVTLTLAPVLEPTPLVRTDRVPAVQALANLLGNAARYSPRGSAVRLFVEPDEACVHFHIEADAAQVPEPVREALFEAIRPGETTLSGAESGSGMAFAIARSLVVSMGGSLSFVGAGEEGAVFTLTLPGA